MDCFTKRQQIVQLNPQTNLEERKNSISILMIGLYKIFMYEVLYLTGGNTKDKNTRQIT